MQNVSALWATFWEMPDTEIEYRFTINGTVYGKESEVSHSVERELYRDFGIGNATGATLNLELFADEGEHKKRCNAADCHSPGNG